VADADVSRQECGVIGTTKTDKNGSRIGCDIEVFSEQTRTSCVLRATSEVGWIGLSLSLPTTMRTEMMQMQTYRTTLGFR